MVAIENYLPKFYIDYFQNNRFFLNLANDIIKEGASREIKFFHFFLLLPKIPLLSQECIPNVLNPREIS